MGAFSTKSQIEIRGFMMARRRKLVRQAWRRTERDRRMAAAALRQQGWPEAEVRALIDAYRDVLRGCAYPGELAAAGLVDRLRPGDLA